MIRLLSTLLAGATVLLSQQGPMVAGCTPRTLAGRDVCVCGSFPQGSWREVRIAGRPFTQVLKETERVLHLQVPEDTPAGAQVIAAESGPPGQALVEVLQVSATIDSSALLRGQTTNLRLTVEGATDPITLRLMNHTPEIVRIQGGDDQEVTTSGGSANIAERQVRAVARGNFQIDYTLTIAGACPCASEEILERHATGYLPAQVLATISLAPPAAMAAVAQAVATAAGLTVADVTALPTVNAGLVTLTVPDARAVPVVVAALQTLPQVLTAQPDFEYDTSGQAAPAQGASYGRSLIGADRLPAALTGKGVRIAIIDTGIDAAHPALTGSIAAQEDFTGQGYSADVHGTLVAGILAARPNRVAGFQGIAPQAEILSLKACQPYARQSMGAQCWSSSLAKAMDHALGQNVQLINLSIASRRDDSLLQRLFAIAAGSVEQGVEAAARKAVPVIAAAGNEGPDADPPLPAALDTVIAVTAVDAATELYPQANRGPFIDVAAPGVEVVSTAPGSLFPVSSGTSFATAYATGMAALLLQERPDLSPAELQTYLESAARDLGPAGKDPQFGSGLLDACAAVNRLTERQSCR